MDIDPAARAKNAEHLANDLLRLIGVMENPVRVNIVKASILKWKMARVRLMNNCEIADALARQFYMLRRQIYSGSQRPMLCELQ